MQVVDQKIAFIVSVVYKNISFHFFLNISGMFSSVDAEFAN